MECDAARIKRLHSEALRRKIAASLHPELVPDVGAFMKNAADAYAKADRDAAWDRITDELKARGMVAVPLAWYRNVVGGAAPTPAFPATALRKMHGER